MSSKSLNCGRQVGLDDERRLLARAHGHARALLDDALLEDAPRGTRPMRRTLGPVACCIARITAVI